MYKFNVEKTTEALIQWIRNWFDHNGKDCKAVLGMSGGKDSTICAALLVKALGKDRVVGVMMPENYQGLNDADKICKTLGIQCIEASIGNIVSSIYNSDIRSLEDNCTWKLENFSKQAETNIPPRVRMIVLYAISQTINGRVINTCNLSENLIGYETIFGDAAGDMSPLGCLTVTEIKQIGHYLGIPSEWVDKTPDDGLPNSHPDEEKFGFTYDLLDRWIRTPDSKHTQNELDDLEKIQKMYENSAFKREPMATFTLSIDMLYVPDPEVAKPTV